MSRRVASLPGLTAIVGLLTLAGCDLNAFGSKMVDRTVGSVVYPVVSRELPPDQAQSATDCIVKSASADEQRALARDVAVEAGSSTKATIRAIALRPETAACFAAHGVPGVRA